MVALGTLKPGQKFRAWDRFEGVVLAVGPGSVHIDITRLGELPQDKDPTLPAVPRQERTHWSTSTSVEALDEYVDLSALPGSKAGVRRKKREEDMAAALRARAQGLPAPPSSQLPLHRLAKVTNPKSGRPVTVCVNKEGVIPPSYRPMCGGLEKVETWYEFRVATFKEARQMLEEKMNEQA